jgi:hypothetical protein
LKEFVVFRGKKSNSLGDVSEWWRLLSQDLRSKKNLRTEEYAFHDGIWESRETVLGLAIHMDVYIWPIEEGGL